MTILEIITVYDQMSSGLFKNNTHYWNDLYQIELLVFVVLETI